MRLGRKVDEFQQSRPPERVWGTVRDRLRGLDGLVINLECVLSTRGQQPPHFCPAGTFAR